MTSWKVVDLVMVAGVAHSRNSKVVGQYSEQQQECRTLEAPASASTTVILHMQSVSELLQR